MEVYSRQFAANANLPRIATSLQMVTSPPTESTFLQLLSCHDARQLLMAFEWNLRTYVMPGGRISANQVS